MSKLSKVLAAAALAGALLALVPVAAPAAPTIANLRVEARGPQGREAGGGGRGEHEVGAGRHGQQRTDRAEADRARA